MALRRRGERRAQLRRWSGAKRDGVRWLEADLGGARAAFTTRLGGVSAAPSTASTSASSPTTSPAACVENRHRLAGALGLDPDRVPIARQVHGAELAVHPGRSAAVPYRASRGSAIRPRSTATSSPRPACRRSSSSPTACRSRSRGPGGVAMLHCGWRGLAAGIVARGAEAVGATDAAIGPGIGPCCYEVGDEVLAAFADARRRAIADGPACSTWPRWRGGCCARPGSSGSRAPASAPAASRELFFSHRRDAGRTGRQAGLAWLERGGLRCRA